MESRREATGFTSTTSSRSPGARSAGVILVLEVPTVYLIRHADVENPHRVLYGHLDGFPLSSLGRAQAAALSDRLQGSGIRRLVSSPLERARETAGFIAARLDGVEVEIDSELREAEMSRHLQGLRYWQIPLLRPKWYVHKLKRGVLPFDESIPALGGRILAVARRLARESPGHSSACISHADPLQAAWVLLDNRPHTEREMHRRTVDRAGMLKVEFEGERAVRWDYTPPPTVVAGPTPSPPERARQPGEES